VTRTLKSLVHPQDAAALLTRLNRLRPDSPRRWGRMTAHGMVCHLRDAFLMDTAQKPVSHLTGLRHRTIVKWIALYVPVRWPANIATRPEIDQTIGGTRPADFEVDVRALEAVMHLVTAQPDFFAGRRHPIFGVLSHAAWMRWGYLHVDHHLRQFGV
jgi:uncharacterized protein DUF1569